MSRRREVAKRETLPDPRFGSVEVAKFINRVMLDGKKSIAEHIVYGALEIVLEKSKSINIKSHDEKESEDGNEAGSNSGGSSTGSNVSKLGPVELLELALDNVRPVVEVRSRRVGGATYQVPVEVKAVRRNTLAMRWIVESAKARSEKGMYKKLAGEIIDAISGKGASVGKRENAHKMAKANQAFAHFRWS